MKKFLIILLSVLICFSFCSCNSRNEDTGNSQNQTKSVLQSESSSVTGIAEYSNHSEKQVESSRNKENSSKNISSKDVLSSDSIDKKNDTTKHTTTKPIKSPQDTSEKTSVSCTVSIECSVILNNMDKLKDGHEEFIPKDGIIMDKTKIILKSGETVYDAVKRACDKSGVRLDSVKSSYGTYIVGFNFIDEKDCGKTSGWIYFVNGSSPSASVSKYKIKDGDNIVFSYTVNK